MVTILGQHLTKIYNRQIIFADFNATIRPQESLAILGSNGSGKSTLLKCLIGFTDPTSGKVSYLLTDKKVLTAGRIFEKISASSPGQYFEPNMVLRDIVKLHFSFRESYLGNNEDFFESFGHSHISTKKVYQLSSGQLQRFKLMLCFATKSDILALDEPCTNLDRQGIEWYQSLIESWSKGRTVLIASNREEEWFFCDRQLNLADYKSPSL